jgi:hypothetical protein
MDTENSPVTTFAVNALLICADESFLEAAKAILQRLQVTPEIAADCDGALAVIEKREFDIIFLEWRDIERVAAFLGAVRCSELNPDCVLVAIASGSRHPGQPSRMGVHFVIHKPASLEQIERCLHMAYAAALARRRKQHREPVNMVALVRTSSQAYARAMIVNLSDNGVGLRLQAEADSVVAYLSVGEEVDLRFTLPETEKTLQTTGFVIWTSASHCGVRFTHMHDREQYLLDQWMTACVERSLKEAVRGPEGSGPTSGQNQK